MADDNPLSWGAKPVAPASEDPASWGAKRVEDPSYLDYAKDIGKQVVSAVPRIAEGAATWPAQLMDVAGQGMAAVGLSDPEKEAQRQAFLKNIREKGTIGSVEKYLPKAETLPGKYAGTIAEFAGGAALSPGRLAVTVPAAVTGGLASEAAGQATKEAGPMAEGVSRILGAVAGTAGVIGGHGIARRFTTAGGSEIAQARLTKAFTRDGDTPDAALQRLQEVRQVRPEATLTDVAGPEVRNVLELVTQSPGPAKAVTIPFLEARQRGQMNRLVGDLTQATGSQQTAFRAIEDTMAARRNAAAPLYQQAYADGDRAVWSSGLERLTSAPFVQSAMRRAVTTWRNQAVADGYGAMNPGAMVDRGGLLRFTGGQLPAFPNIQFWDYTKRMLDDQVSSALRAGQNQKARTLTQLLTNLRGELDQQVPSYAGARNAWSGPSRYMEAIEDGRSILSRNMTAEELAATFRGMPEAEREAYRIGVVSTIRNTMASNPAKMPDLTRVIRSPEMRAKLGVIMPSQEAAARFARSLDYEVQSAATANQALTGSATARRLAAMEDANNLVGELAMVALPHKLGGTGLWSLPTKGVKWAQSKLRAKSDEEIARTLTSPYPASALAQQPQARPANVRGAVQGTAIGLGASPGDQNAQQYPSRQAGGGVPAIGGTGGRSPGARETSRAGAARQGPSQALQDGGAAGDEEADQGYAEGGEVAAQPQPGLRERWGALQSGTIAGGGGKPGRNPAPLLRKDIVDTLRRHGINDKEVLSGWAEGQDVDSRAIGGSVDYETGERNPTARYDPGDETTFGSRFGQWDQTSEGKSVPRDEEDVDTTIMAPGQKMIDPLGHRGTRLPSGPWFYTRGMAEGGEVGRDRWQSLPSSRNIEDRRSEDPLSIGQLVAGNQAFMGHYPSPYTRAPRKPATAEARQTGGLVRSVLRRLTPEARMLEASRGEAPLRGLPQKPLDVGGEKFIPGPSADVREAARQYMSEKGLPYTPVQNYVPVDEPRARAIARAYDVMPHRPTDPEVQRSYEALAKETRDQYELLNRRLGVKFEPLPPNVPDPYGATPRLAAKDFLENKHMYYFPTEQGFGSEASGIVAKEGQKMLEPSGVRVGGKEVPFNDLFRVVHDVFGHHKEGVGFRAAGEENAWRSHGRMYSPEALPAMTAETRGQNSWVNYGPEAAKNKGASSAETIYAPQKLGILPPWVIRSGRMTPLGVAGAAAALEEGDREPDEQKFRFADGGEVNEPPLPDVVMDAWERGALRTKRGVLGAETMEGRGRPGDKFVEAPGQKEEAARRTFDFAVPQSPLDFGLMALGGPFRWPIKAGALALGATIEPSEAEAGKLGAGRKIVSKITGSEVPAAGRAVTRSHNMPPEELAPYPHYAEEYPAVGPPVLKPKTKPKYPGETYEAKKLTPEAEAFAEERLRIQNEMDEKGYQPYFDPAKRTHVDPSNYPAANVDTLTVQPKKPQTLMEYQDIINMPATRELLRAAYERGLNLGDAKNWYAMAQLEEAYTKELGPKAGRKAFLDEFAVPMSAMTSGNDPETNFLLAQYAEHLRKQGKALPEEGHQLPVTVGGRRGAVNIRDYNAMRARGGYQGLGADQPKMHNFTRNIIGDPSRATIDEQMATGMTKHIQDVDPKFPDRARRQAFGLMEKPVHEEAAAVGVPPANYQDVAWAGFKNEPGKPLISTINDAIERTHRLTGMPRDEIVRRGLIRKEIPIYGLTAAATPFLWNSLRSQEGGSNNPTPAGRLPL